MDSRDSERRALVELANVSKWFGSTRALEGVSFDLDPGEVHVVAGENGAGKSTLIRILSGAITDYAGELRVDGVVRRFRGPVDAAHAGIAAIHQELSLVPALSVTDNLLLGESGALFGRLDLEARRARASALLAAVELDIDPEARVEELALSQRQLVEIARALGQRARALIMDEPTSALSEREAARLFERVERLCEQGTGVLYITHRMEEIYRLARRITVLRDGRHVVTARAADLPADTLVAQMVGREVRAAAQAPRARAAEDVLTVHGLALGGDDLVELRLGRGEVLGLAGLAGSGTSALLHALFGDGAPLGGSAVLDGRHYAPRAPADAIARGVVLLAADRHESVFGHLSVLHNATLSSLERFSRASWLLDDRERREVARVAGDVRLHAPDLDAPAAALSGGNQQKVALMRCLVREPRVLLLDEPTRGIDVAAKEDVYALIAALRSRGVGIVLVASEMEELIRLSDRIVVLFRARVAARFDARPFDRRRILQAAMGGDRQVA